jgi:hypothetical protein
MSDIKEIKLTGGLGMEVSKKRRSRKVSFGGGSTSPGTIVQLQTTSTSDVQGLSSKLTTQASPIVNSPVLANSLLTGGKKRVILKAAPKKENRVTLSVSKMPKSIEHLNSNTTLKNKTHKTSQKIKFSLKHLNKKINKARTIKKQSEEKSLDEIKKILSDAKLIKVDSKAPEAMIRQIYSDFMVLKHKAL